MWALAAAAVVVVAAVLLYPRFGGAEKAPEKEAPPSAPAAKVVRENLVQNEVIPAEFRPYEMVELHAKVSGYLDRMNVDFGDMVKSNELLATIEVPELADQLNNAIAAEARARADYTNANLMYTRLVKVNQEHRNLVAQQDIDTANAKNETALAAIEAAKADVGRCRGRCPATRTFTRRSTGW